MTFAKYWTRIQFSMDLIKCNIFRKLTCTETHRTQPIGNCIKFFSEYIEQIVWDENVEKRKLNWRNQKQYGKEKQENKINILRKQELITNTQFQRKVLCRKMLLIFLDFFFVVVLILFVVRFRFDRHDKGIVPFSLSLSGWKIEENDYEPKMYSFHLNGMPFQNMVCVIFF